MRIETVLDFGRAVRAGRAAAGLSLNQLAELVGVHYTYFSHIENGRRTPSLEVALLILEALELELHVEPVPD